MGPSQSFQQVEGRKGQEGWGEMIPWMCNLCNVHAHGNNSNSTIAKPLRIGSAVNAFYNSAGVCGKHASSWKTDPEVGGFQQIATAAKELLAPEIPLCREAKIACSEQGSWLLRRQRRDWWRAFSRGWAGQEACTGKAVLKQQTQKI